MTSTTNVRPPLWRSIADCLGAGMFYAAASANSASLEYTLLALLLGFFVNAISHLALLIVRRRHGLILHGLKNGFFTCPEVSVDDLVSTGSPLKPSNAAMSPLHPSNSASSAKGQPLALTVVAPRHESMVTPSLGPKRWDPNCSVINEGAPYFTRDLLVIEMFDFFHNPLEARGFALVFAIARFSVLVVNLSVVEVTARLLLPATVPPELGIVVVLTLSALAMIHRPPAVCDVVRFLLLAGTVALLVLHGLTDGFAIDAFDHRRLTTLRPEVPWYYLVFTATCLAVESQGQLDPYFCATPRPRLPTDPIETLSNSPNFTGQSARQCFFGVLALFGARAAGVAFFVVLAFFTLPGYGGGVPLTIYAAERTLPQLAANGMASLWGIAWLSAAVVAVWCDVPSHVANAQKTVVALQYLVRPRSVKEARAVSYLYLFGVLVLGLLLERYYLDATVFAFRIATLFCSAVAPFVVLRCSRMCARRLGVPRKLDDALRVPPLIRRACLTVGVVALLLAIGGALGWF